MIEDGCPDIECGQILEWPALEFSSESTLAITKTKSRGAFEPDHHRYSVTAEVIYLSDTASIMDFGLNAIGRRGLLLPECRLGDFVTGEIYVEFPLCTEIVPDQVFASLAYGWNVVSILADLTPHIARQARNGRKVMIRD
jgi:hypothetical protein